MSFKATQRIIHRIGNVENWINATDLTNRRIRLLDVENQVIGRAATVISMSLQGKDRPDFTPQADGGDVVVVVNADKAIFTGNKMDEKTYYRHMGKPGNLRKSTPREKKDMFGGAELIWKAVNGMLPKNKLRKRRLSRLLVYNDDNHDFDESFMSTLHPPSRTTEKNKLRWNLPEGYTPINAPAYYALWKGTDEPWEQRLQEESQRLIEEEKKLFEGGWQPPVPLDASPDDVARQLPRGMRIQ